MPLGAGVRPVARRGPLTDAPARLPSAPNACNDPARPHTGQEGAGSSYRGEGAQGPCKHGCLWSLTYSGGGGASATAGTARPGGGHRRVPRTPPLTPASWHTRAAVGGSGPGPGALNNIPVAVPRCPEHDALWLPSSRANWTSALAHTAREERAPGPAPTVASADTSSVHSPCLPRAAHGRREQRRLRPTRHKQRLPSH